MVGEHFEGQAGEGTLRQGAKGRLTSRFWSRTVWVWDEKNAKPPRMRTLLVREDESGEMKYRLANLPVETELPRLAYIQNQRYWIENAFHEAKSQLGMARYQVRVWQGWHHHRALVCMATVLVAREKRKKRVEFPLLSYRDIVELLDYYLPRRGREEGGACANQKTPCGKATRHRPKPASQPGSAKRSCQNAWLVKMMTVIAVF